MTRLGVNIDHVATVRQARRENFPDPTEAALAAVNGGADGITAHLREDRRHIQDNDILQLKNLLPVPLNMEMAATSELVDIACRVRPVWACLVPEKRTELTTEGGLNVAAMQKPLADAIARLAAAGIKVSLFIEPSADIARLSKKIGASAVEFHTGGYAKAFETDSRGKNEIVKITDAALAAKDAGLLVNAGHGLNYENVEPLLRAFSFDEFNIGFAIVARALFVGMESAVSEMKRRISVPCAAS
jgi:pyridoxine 5-phosphate synthase